MRKRATVATIAAAAVPLKAQAHHSGHVPGCRTDRCDGRIGARWARRHQVLARAAVVAPLRPWLKRLAMCESSDNTHAVSPDGLYRGLYQFDLRTWASVGGRGDPAQASRSEQDYRAVLLFQRRGTAPWPVCG